MIYEPQKSGITLFTVGQYWGRPKTGCRCWSDVRVAEIGYIMQRIGAGMWLLCKRTSLSKLRSHKEVVETRCELERKHSCQKHGHNCRNLLRGCRNETKLVSLEEYRCGIIAIYRNCQFGIWSCDTDRPCANTQTITNAPSYGHIRAWFGHDDSTIVE